ncbi:hypothetical protein FHG87_012206 [Trinorchestia longiramus]|nr:hypothetical protein FHG87_012206 [Trinorchestia longiramus]
MRLTTYMTIVTGLTVQSWKTVLPADVVPLRALESFTGDNMTHTISFTESQVFEQRLLPRIIRIDFTKPKRNLGKRSGGTRSLEMPRLVKRLMGVELPDYIHGRRALQLLRQRLLLAG